MNWKLTRNGDFPKDRKILLRRNEWTYVGIFEGRIANGGAYFFIDGHANHRRRADWWCEYPEELKQYPTGEAPEYDIA